MIRNNCAKRPGPILMLRSKISERGISTFTKKRHLLKIACERDFPQVWKIKLTDQEVFSFFYYVYPVHPVIRKVLENTSSVRSSECRIPLSVKYIWKAKGIFPGYYSDNERLIIMIAKYIWDQQIDEFDSWLKFFSNTSDQRIVQFLLGIIALNDYLKSGSGESLLLSAQFHFSRASKSDPDNRTFKAMFYFSSYMRQEIPLYSFSRFFSGKAA